MSDSITLNHYQRLAGQTANYKLEDVVIYTALGLAGEAGEVANKVKKQMRDRGGDFSDPVFIDTLADELGDVLWYVAMTARDLGLDLEDIAGRNIAKLADRQRRGVIGGTGDKR